MHAHLVIDNAAPRQPAVLRRAGGGPASPDVQLAASWARWSFDVGVLRLVVRRQWNAEWPRWQEVLRGMRDLSWAVDHLALRALTAAGTGALHLFRRRLFVIAAALAVLAVAAVPVGAYASVGVLEAVAARNTDPVRLPPLARPSTIVARDGQTLGAFSNGEFQRPVGLHDIAPVLVRAVVDTEDERYWDHQGLDARGLVRAAVVDVRARRIRQGGSTIAQQLAKITYLSSERSMTRKVSEMVLAQRLHRQLGHRRLLERYLNSIYLGNRAYGVEAAARRYFGVPASRVTIGQAALLAGLIHDPRGDDPVAHPEAALARRAEVLDLLLAHHHVTPADAAAGAAEPLPTAVVEPDPHQGWVLDEVRAELLDDDRLGPTRAARERLLTTGGLQIVTTIDPHLQATASRALAAHVPHGLDAGFVAVDPRNGAIRAVVGGVAYARSQYDVATSAPGRQPGSGAKLFTLLTALEHGMTATSPVMGSAPCPIKNPGGTPNPWVPGNFEGEAFGQLTLADATAHSVNCAFARLVGHFGADKVAAMARRLGVTTPLPAVLSITLGAVPVKPVEMAAAYGTVANHGVWHKPHIVAEARTASGRTLIGGVPEGKQVLAPRDAAAATRILRGVVLKGTGTRAAIPGWDILGKTGTTNRSQDAWFNGATTTIAASVWLGHREGEIPMARMGGRQVVGGGLPAQLWRAALAGWPTPPPLPAGPPGTTEVGTTQPPAVMPGTSSWCWSSCGHTGPPPPGFFAAR